MTCFEPESFHSWIPLFRGFWFFTSDILKLSVIDLFYWATVCTWKGGRRKLTNARDFVGCLLSNGRIRDSSAWLWPTQNSSGQICCYLLVIHGVTAVDKGFFFLKKKLSSRSQLRWTRHIPYRPLVNTAVAVISTCESTVRAVFINSSKYVGQSLPPTIRELLTYLCYSSFHSTAVMEMRRSQWVK